MFPEIPPQETKFIETDIKWEVTHEDIDWEDDDLLDLPEGVKSKVLNRNEAEQRVDQIHRYPAGYYEPEHSHDTAHALLILDGRIIVDGQELTEGDYAYGQKVPHGPSETPEGCTIFASFVGGSITHEWDDKED